MYLIYTTEQDAWNRSEQEGSARGLTYHTEGKGTRYVSAPVPTADGMWALNVSGYTLNDTEVESVVDSYLIPDTIEDNI